MPIETAKEVAKSIVETSSNSAIWQWIVGGFGAIGTGIVAGWGHLTGRIKTLEDSAISKKQLEDHTREENDKFNNLFQEVRSIGKAVARIEGMLDK